MISQNNRRVKTALALFLACAALLLCAVAGTAAAKPSGLTYGSVIPTDASCKTYVDKYNFSGDSGTMYFWRSSKGKTNAMYVIEIANSAKEQIRYFKSPYGDAGEKPFAIPWTFKDTPSGTYYGKCYTYLEDKGEVVEDTVREFTIRIDRMSGKTTIPKAVANVTGGIKVTWTAVPTAKKYEILRKAPGQKYWKVYATVGSKATSYTDAGVTAGKTYKYSLRAVDGSFKTKYSGKGLSLLRLTTVNITSVGPGSNGLPILRWKQVTGANGYYVYRKGGALNETSWKRIATIKKGTTVSYTDKTANSSDWPYQYVITAYSGSAKSAFAGAVSFDFIPAVRLGGVYRAYGGLKVTWAASPMKLDHYNVYRKAPGEKYWKYIGRTATTAFTDTKVSNGSTYKYTVRGVSANNAGAYDTAGISRKFVAAPTVSAVTFNAAENAVVRWTAVSGATQYRVYRKINNAKSWTQIAALKSTKTAYTDTVAKTPGATYTYTVVAYNGTTTSAYSNARTYMFLKMPVVTLATAATADKPCGVTVTWTASKGAASYTVYRKQEGATSWTALKTGLKTLTYTDTTCESGVRYEYTARAFNGSYKSLFEGKSIVALAAPAISKITIQESGTSVIWEAVPGAKIYSLYKRAVTANAWTKVESTTGTSLIDPEATVNNAVDAYYRVEAQSGTLTNSLPDGSPNFYCAESFTADIVYENPDDPTDTDGYPQVVLNAEQAASALTITVSKNGGDPAMLMQVNAAATISNLTDENVALGDVCTYTLTTVKKGLLPGSVTVTAALKLPVPALTVKGVYADNGSYAALAWNAVQNATEYEVYRRTASSAWEKLAMVPATSTLAYKDVSVALDVEYYYSVKAVATDDRGSSFDENGMPVTVYTPLDYVTGISAELDQETPTTVHLKWDAQKNVAGYNVFRVRNADGAVTDWDKPLATVSGTAYDDAALNIGKYTYTVVAVPQEEGRTARVNNTGATVTVLDITYVNLDEIPDMNGDNRVDALDVRDYRASLIA